MIIKKLNIFSGNSKSDHSDHKVVSSLSEKLFVVISYTKTLDNKYHLFIYTPGINYYFKSYWYNNKDAFYNILDNIILNDGRRISSKYYFLIEQHNIRVMNSYANIINLLKNDKNNKRK